MIRAIRAETNPDGRARRRLAAGPTEALEALAGRFEPPHAAIESGRGRRQAGRGTPRAIRAVVGRAGPPGRVDLPAPSSATARKRRAGGGCQ